MPQPVLLCMLSIIKKPQDYDIMAIPFRTLNEPPPCLGKPSSRQDVTRWSGRSQVTFFLPRPRIIWRSVCPLTDYATVSKPFLGSSPLKSTLPHSPVQRSLEQVIQTHNQALVQHEEMWGSKEPERLGCTAPGGAPLTQLFCQQPGVGRLASSLSSLGTNVKCLTWGS